MQVPSFSLLLLFCHNNLLYLNNITYFIQLFDLVFFPPKFHYYYLKNLLMLIILLQIYRLPIYYIY